MLEIRNMTHLLLLGLLLTLSSSVKASDKAKEYKTDSNIAYRTGSNVMYAAGGGGAAFRFTAFFFTALRFGAR